MQRGTEHWSLCNPKERRIKAIMKWNVQVRKGKSLAGCPSISKDTMIRRPSIKCIPLQIAQRDVAFIIKHPYIFTPFSLKTPETRVTPDFRSILMHESIYLD